MATAPPLHAAFPSGPLINTTSGEMNPVWRAFFTALYVRTGGTVGASSDTSAISSDLASESTARSTADAALSNAIAAERTARENADIAEANTRSTADNGKLSTSGGSVTGPLRAIGGLGVLGSAAVTTRPVVTGSKGANAALGSLLAALASYGLITDSSS